MRKWKSIGLSACLFLIIAAVVLFPLFFSFSAAHEETIGFETVSGEGTDPVTAYPVYTARSEFISDMDWVAENRFYTLYLHKRLAAIALYDKTTNTYYFSNPYDVEQGSDNAGDMKNRQRSQLILTYYSDDNTQKELNSFSDSIAKGQYRISNLKDGIRVQMSLGELGDAQLMPEQISAETLDKLLEGLDGDDAQSLLDCYRRYTIKDVSDEVRKELLAKYPYLERDDLYVAYTLSKKEIKTYSAMLEEAGFDFEKKRQDYQKTGFKDSDQILPAFTVAIEYVLDEEGLTASVSMDEISYPSRNYQIDSIVLLPYFGCGKADDNNGELFAPDGCGVVLNYNSNLQKSASSLTVQVYGQDAANINHTAFSSTQQAFLPVFGNRNSMGSFLAVIEEGESVCSITANSGSASDSFPSAFAEAKYRYNETWYYNDRDFSKYVVSYAPAHNKGAIRVRYIPLSPESGYLSMAFAYRQYLENRKVLTKSNIQPRLLLQLLGYTEDSKGRVSLTDFNDAAKIIDELGGMGIENMALRYLGWTGGGLSNQYIRRATIDSVMGGKSGWNRLADQAANASVPLYMDMELSYVNKTPVFGGFSANRDACRSIRNKLTGLYPYNYGSNSIDTSRLLYGVSPARLAGDSGDLAKSISEAIPGTAVSTGSLGRALNSNFKNGSEITRPEAQSMIKQSLDSISGGKKLMLEGANAYTLGFCASVINLPMTSSSFAASDYDVPFYQLVLNGYTEYSGAPINESGNTVDSLLKAIETNASISYIAALKNQGRLKNADSNGYYSVNYPVLKAEMAAMYKQLAVANKKTDGAVITGHERLAPDVYKTTFSNGAAVVLNYRNTDYKENGLAIEAKNYLFV